MFRVVRYGVVPSAPVHVGLPLLFLWSFVMLLAFSKLFVRFCPVTCTAFFSLCMETVVWKLSNGSDVSKICCRPHFWCGPLVALIDVTVMSVPPRCNLPSNVGFYRKGMGFAFFILCVM